VLTGPLIASRISTLETSTDFGRPVSKSRPRNVTRFSSSSG
jgi:hypothetical protein